MLIEVSLLGRKNVGTEDFDQLGGPTRQPLRIDVGLPIIQVISVRKLHNARWPDPLVSGTAVAIGPGIIDHASSILIELLVDGRNPTLTCVNNPFKDIKVEQWKDPTQNSDIHKELYVGAMLRVP